MNKMKIRICRTKKLHECYYNESKYVISCADQVLEQYNIKPINPLDFDNFDEIKWEGIEFNRLFTDEHGVVYRFNHWIGEYPFSGIEIEEIGMIIK